MQPTIKTQVDIGSKRPIVIDHKKIAIAEFTPMKEGWHYAEGTYGQPDSLRQVAGPDPRMGGYNPAGPRREACLQLWNEGTAKDYPPDVYIPGEEPKQQVIQSYYRAFFFACVRVDRNDKERRRAHAWAAGLQGPSSQNAVPGDE